ncbi:MAG TPA: protein kinase [Candidatus Solibacter sp.]|nr:protein kinase [Candidatus Solibacter sp.]
MTPERWQQIREIFDQALTVEAHERPPFLEKTCAGDADLRQEVESLLASDHEAGTKFLNTPAVDLAHAEPNPGPSRVGRRTGAYTILEEIGHGGMGEVYRAGRADGQYEKEVAIKLVRGGYDTAAVLERFRHERQILASLDHPNIARLLDGGTTDEGIPYLVMELIEGIPIDRYCNAHDLNVNQRLRLFLQVCSAVQYAHQRLVIHRDLKPGNILVTKEGVPKLLDFGIAKILDPAAGVEATIAGPLTPEYASPEQVRGEPITTASDVYSLGVVLYQLLAGRSPYPPKTKTPHEFARAICESEPDRPSVAVLKPPQAAESEEAKLPDAARAKLRRRLAGDLDDIVMMALRKEPQRRYASVEQFTEDIRRHLDGLPVIARRDSWRYRAGKFAIRHKLAATASALVLLAIAGGVAATIREARIADAHQRRAEQRFNDVRKLANSLMFEIDEAIRDLPGSTPARRLLVTRAQEYLDSLNQQAKGDVSLQKELASAYDRVGDVLGYPYAANLGDNRAALENYRKAQAIRESLISAAPNDIDLQRDLVGTYLRLAQVAEASGDFIESLSALAKALPIAEKLAAGSKDPVLADHYAGVYYFTGMVQVQVGNISAALENYQRGAAVRDVALQSNPGIMPLRAHLAADFGGIANCYELKGDLAHAIETQSKAVAILTDVAKSNPENATLSEYLGEGVNRLGTYRQENGESAAALDAFRQAHEIFGKLVAADPKNTLAKSNFGFTNNGIGLALSNTGKGDEAVKVLRESVATFDELSPRTTANRYVRSGLAEAYEDLGRAYSGLAMKPRTAGAQRQEYWQEAKSACQKSLVVWSEKERRRELQSGEGAESKRVADCVAISESHLAGTAVSRN